MIAIHKKLTLTLFLGFLTTFAFQYSIAQNATPSPTLYTTFYNYPISTWIVTPAYNVSNIDQLPTFAALFDLPDCAPPCFWGLKPGQSTADDVFDVLYRAGFLKNLEDGVPFYLNRTNERIAQGIRFDFNSYRNPSTSVYFLVDKQVLKQINLSDSGGSDWRTDEDSMFSLVNVFRRTVAVPEIYVQPTSSESLLADTINMMFIYRELGVMLYYLFDFSSEFESEAFPQFTICPSVNHVKSLEWGFWDSKDDPSGYGLTFAIGQERV